MIQHLLSSEVEEVRVLSRDELKQHILRTRLGDDRVRFFVGDTRDRDSLPQFLSKAHFVFHAAALKQVPTGEFFPMEMVKTNIIGSQNVLEEAVRAGAEAVVCLSTDKAVYPINAMGISKALMEKIALAQASRLKGSGTRITVTRYGNVMFSRGSVLPLFARQVAENREVTITNPKMTRYLMSLKESVDLVEYAFTGGSNGDLLVRKAPAATIANLAQAVISLLDGDPKKIRIIGSRHGEKLFESLLSAEEMSVASDHGDYFRVASDDRDLNYEMYFDSGVKGSYQEPYTSHNTSQLDVPSLLALLENTPEIKAHQK